MRARPLPLLTFVQAAAWSILFQMLQLDTITGPVQMFTATSLKGKASPNMPGVILPH